MVYPSSVYLNNLETANDTPVKATNRSEALTDEENFEDDLNHRTTTSRAQITRKVTLTDNNSVSSLDTIKSEEALDPKRPRNSSESNSETAALTQKDSLGMFPHKNFIKFLVTSLFCKNLLHFHKQNSKNFNIGHIDQKMNNFKAIFHQKLLIKF